MELYSTKMNEPLPAEPCGKFYIIKHSDLEKAAAKLKADYKMEIVSMEKEHALVICKVKYKETEYSTIGEATKTTLWDEVDKEYPVTMAWNRAFDRAIIKLLNFSEPVFSNKEIRKEQFAKKQGSACEAPTQTAHETTQAEATGTNKSQPTKPVNSTVTAKKTYTKNATKTPQRSQTITFGRWNGFTFEEAEKEEGFKEWVQWLRSACVSFKDPVKTQQVEYLLKNY